MESTANQRQVSVGDDVFRDGGEMGALMRTMDWAATPLGQVEQWPQSLRTAVSICLHSRFPILIWWGPELVMLYNDAYRDILGAKHPRSMGQCGRECWPEIWDVIGPMLQGVLHKGDATWSDDQLLLLNRNGYVEECYFTFSYSPIYGESGGVEGVFCAVTETSDRVLGERRLRTLRELAADASEARTPAEACRLAALALATNPADLPFTLLCATDKATVTGDDAPTLAASTGFTQATDAQALAGTEPLNSAIRRVLRTCEAEVVEESDGMQAIPVQLTLAGGEMQSATHTALLLPIAQPGAQQCDSVLVAGISPLRALDESYRSFLALVAGQIATTLTTANAYEEERRRSEALAELDRAKTAFFSNVSHEFRTPLTLLLGPLADLLANETAVTPDVYAQIELAQRNGLRLLRLVNALLDFSRIEAGRIGAIYEPTDLSTYTAELASSFRSLVEKAGLRLVVDCPPLNDLPQPVYVDRAMWEKIVLNLLSNAYKFTFSGEIDVSLRRVGDGVELVAHDTGVGVPADEVGRLFERFHRVEGAHARTHEGSGIGLALTQELVHLHGGSIRVESVEGEGTTFFVRLPLGATHLPAELVQAASTSKAHAGKAATTATVAAAAYVEEAARWAPDAEGMMAQLASQPGLDSVTPSVTPMAEAHSARILIAEDNADMRDYLHHMLNEQYTVETVANGAQALEAIARQAPDLVVSDVMMPVLDGFGLLRELRDDPRTATIPIILLSARAGEEAVVEGLQAGADDYLIKPFSARELLSRVAARLELALARKQVTTRAQQLESIFAAMADGVVIYDEAGSMMTWNAATATIFEFDAMPDYAGLPVAARPGRLQVRDEHNQPLAGEQLPFMRAMRGEPLTGAHAVD
ncbi:MAG: response regulator, partial [Ktedonobacterales bacterium]